MEGVEEVCREHEGREGTALGNSARKRIFLRRGEGRGGDT